MASPSSSEFSEVIDWTEAMEQCGDDEEFLQELLGDLKGEIDTQIVKMDGVLEVSCMYVYVCYSVDAVAGVMLLFSRFGWRKGKFLLQRFL